jgi:hypothetical protein
LPSGFFITLLSDTQIAFSAEFITPPLLAITNQQLRGYQLATSIGPLSGPVTFSAPPSPYPTIPLDPTSSVVLLSITSISAATFLATVLPTQSSASNQPQKRL